MFEYQNNTLCVRASWLQEEGIVSLSNLRNLKSNKKVRRAKYGGGLGGYALYVYESLPERFRNIIEIDMGIDPYREGRYVDIASYLKENIDAEVFLSDYTLDDGRLLCEVHQAAVNEYYANAVVLTAVHSALVEMKQAGCKIKKSELWSRISKGIHGRFTADIKARFPYDLPENPRALRAKYEAYKLERPSKRYPRTGLEGLIHGNYCNSYGQKINKEIGEWLNCQYALPTKPFISKVLTEYDKARPEKGWPQLSESGIENFLMKPENMRFWLLPREGEEAYMRVYGHTLSRDKERLFPNAHWAIDGTKLDNVHYWDTKAKMGAKAKINILVDVYSEKILGYSFSQTENHVDHFIAVKMAVSTTGARPHLFTYDAQSGHRMKRMQKLYSKVVAHRGKHYHHKVGRKSNPIEQMFNRMQQQVFNTRWFSDGQSIKSKRRSSIPNMDFIEQNKGALPTMEELKKHFEIMVQEWNSAPRSRKTTKTRNEYYQTPDIRIQHINTLDAISMFWLEETNPKKYYGNGMPLQVAGVDYLYEVYDREGQVDMEFRFKYVGQKLVVCYDPDYLDEFVALYRVNKNGENVFLAYAENKRRHVDVAILKHEGEHAQTLKDMAIRKKELQRDWINYEKVANRIGVTREELIQQTAAQIDDSYELSMKRAGVAEKQDNLDADSNSLFTRMTK